MANPNHVRALVHATGNTMTWAINYYKAFRFELSQKTVDDMTIDDVVDLSAGNPAVTFTDVLKAMLDASAAGFSEILLVAHGAPKGLIMNMGPGLGAADKEGLPLMTELARVVAERDRIQAMTDSKKQLDAWVALLRRLSRSQIAGTTWGPITDDQLSAIATTSDAQGWLETMAPTHAGKSLLTNQTVLTLLDLRNKVAAKKLTRVEVRACNLGGDSDGMKALREFLGAKTVLAPMVKTFYGQVNPKLFTKDADYMKWLAANVPWVLKHQSDPAHTDRAYLGDDLFLTMTAKSTTPLAVLKIKQPNLQTCAALAGSPTNYAMVKTLVADNIDVKNTSGYQSGPFFVGGLDPQAGRTQSNPPPAAANGKAFLLASDPEYRAMIVSNP
jgi:hypothetical protein